MGEPLQRFRPSRRVLLVDQIAGYLIRAGGVGMITIVLGIFAFVLWQAIPLFKGARVEEVRTVQLPPGDYQVLGLDEYTALPMLIDEKGRIQFIDLIGDRGLIAADLEIPESKEITAFAYEQREQTVLYGSADGEFAILQVEYVPAFADDKRVLSGSVNAGEFQAIGIAGAPIRKMAYGNSGERKLVAVIQEVNGEFQLHAAELVQERSLFGAGEVQVGRKFDLSEVTPEQPVSILVNRNADSVYVAGGDGEVVYLKLEGDNFAVKQRFKPFDDLAEKRVVLMEFLLGDASIVLSNARGENRIFSLYVPEGGAERLLGWTKSFPALEEGAEFYAPSSRNKAFLIGQGGQVSLRFGTTESVRWERTFPFRVTEGRISGKYNSLVLLDDQDRLHILRLRDPHPETNLKSLFGKVWYEGSSEPAYVWQSTGGSDEFEPKLSLVPLIFGTFKGTIYAMLFAVPIALLAAVYTSQFASPFFRGLVKPVMEIMASLPSVVLGFLAALWLAPILETRVPSLLLMAFVVPIGAALIGLAWASLPVRYRVWIKPGYEFLAFMPVFIGLAYLCWELGPALERLLFVVVDPTSGKQVADFRQWWPEVTGADFQQRNSLVVGFVMGFAVIPLIFTIAEDSLSNVPMALRSGSLALGASRWQTTMRVIVPTASAGIFSALMIGLGRAVGETMIVVMATGNTPIMDLNIFSGMRTLSANIAVELPEAPHHGTLYRTLFLGALVLFMMTFFVNTVAELLRQRLRMKYRLT